jgi:hypothetical protein
MAIRAEAIGIPAPVLYADGKHGEAPTNTSQSQHVPNDSLPEFIGGGANHLKLDQ